VTRRPRRAAAAAAIVLASVSGLSACGFNAATDKIQADNAQGSTPMGSVIARNLVLVKSPNAIAAALAGSLINKGTSPDTLETVTLTPDAEPGAQPVVLHPNLTLAPKSVVQWGTVGHDPLTVPNAQNLKLGHFVDLLLHFKTAGDVKVQIETHKREGFYADVLPTVGQNEQADRRLASCTYTPPGGKPRACRTQAEFDRAAKLAAKAAGTSASTTGTTGTATTGTTTTGTTSDDKAGTSPGDAGTLSGDASTGTAGTSGTKSSVTAPATAKAGTQAATRAATRAEKRATAAKSKPGQAKTAPAAPAAADPALGGH
jgi:hypothetical protein